MGIFNINALITHLVSGIVLINMSTVIVSMFLTYLSGEYGKFYQKVKNTYIWLQPFIKSSFRWIRKLFDLVNVNKK